MYGNSQTHLQRSVFARVIMYKLVNTLEQQSISFQMCIAQSIFLGFSFLVFLIIHVIIFELFRRKRRLCKPLFRNIPLASPLYLECSLTISSSSRQLSTLSFLPPPLPYFSDHDVNNEKDNGIDDGDSGLGVRNGISLGLYLSVARFLVG